AAGTQFIDDEDGYIQKRVLAGQTLLTTENPKAAIGTKVEVLSIEPVVNDFPNNGNLLHWVQSNTANVSVVDGYYRFAGAANVPINSNPATTYDRYIAVTKAANIVGSPTINFKN